MAGPVAPVGQPLHNAWVPDCRWAYLSTMRTTDVAGVTEACRRTGSSRMVAPVSDQVVWKERPDPSKRLSVYERMNVDGQTRALAGTAKQNSSVFSVE